MSLNCCKIFILQLKIVVKSFSGIFLVFFIPLFVGAQTVQDLEPIGWVSDFENLFSESEVLALEETIGAFESKTSNEIAIVTISSFSSAENFRDFGVNLFNEWGIGKKDLNNGLLILLSKELRQVHFITGYGTEKVLTDEKCQKIIDSNMIPYFKKGNFFSGLRLGLRSAINQWR